MQSTGQTSTHDLSLMSMQGSAMMYVTSPTLPSGRGGGCGCPPTALQTGAGPCPRSAAYLRTRPPCVLAPLGFHALDGNEPTAAAVASGRRRPFFHDLPR